MNVWKLSTVAFASLFAASLAMHSAQADRQPLMQNALSALKTAQSNLERATTDKGGHRVNALRLTKDAIAEVQKGIAYDNKH